MPSTNDHRWLSGLLLAAILSTALAPMSVAAVLAGTVERVEPSPALGSVPGSEPGQFRTWAQLVWNPATRSLERLTFTAWDPVPSLGLDLSWTPDDPTANAPGRISGQGTLSFRTPGAAAYDPAGTVAQYRGTLVDGRPEGQGEYFDASGFSYVGKWQAGLMDGQGRLTLPDGSDYAGSFRAGLRDGNGVVTDATGRVWSGHFTAGEADAAPLAAQADGSLRLAVVAERRPHNYELGVDPLSYVARSAGETLVVQPDDQRLLDAWHGTSSITMTSDELQAFNSAATKSFLGTRDRFDPVSLVFSLENVTTSTVSVVGGYLDVSSSARDKEPAVQVRPMSLDDCSSPVDLSPEFWLDNFGWTSADNLELRFSASSLDGRNEGTPLTASLGTLTDTLKADLSASLATLGVDTASLPDHTLRCTDPRDERLCLAEVTQSGHFGRLADFVSIDYDKAVVAVNGTVDYDWTGGDGSVSHKSSPFSAVVPLARVVNAAECGEGGEIMPIRPDPFALKLDTQNYRVALPFTADVAAGFTARWRAELAAPETSTHQFRIVLLLADGTLVTSRPIELTYFMPPVLSVFAPR